MPKHASFESVEHMKHVLGEEARQQIQGVESQLAQITYKEFYMSKFDETKDGNITSFLKTKIQEGYQKFIFPKGFMLNEELDLVNIRNGGIGRGIILVGAGGMDMDNVEPHIILNTGGIGIKLSETHDCVLSNLNLSSVDSRATNKSTIGVVLSRDSSISGVGSSHTNKLNISVKMHNDPSVNNGYGTIGVYNDTSETITYDNIIVIANTPVILTRYDLLNINPENTYTQSNKDHFFEGNNILVAHGNDGSNCLVVDGAEQISGNVYFSTTNPSPTSSAIKVTGSFVSGSLNIDCETTPIFLNVENGLVDNVEFKGFLTHLEKMIVTKRTESLTRITGALFNLYLAYKTGLSEKILIEQGSNTEISVTDIRLSNDANDTVSNIYGNLFSVNFYAKNKPTINKLGGTQLGVRSITQSGVYLNNNRRIDSSYGVPPSTYEPFMLGDVFFNTNLNTGDPIGHIYNGTTHQPFGQNGYRLITVANIPTGTPKFKGEIVFDESNNAWIAYGTSQGQFKQMTS